MLCKIIICLKSYWFLNSIEINISGDEVAIPIKMKLDINPDILYFLEILSVDDTSRFAP